MASIKITEITPSGEQNQYIYNGDDNKECLVNCVVQYFYHNFNWYTQSYKDKVAKVQSEIQTLAHFLAWYDATTNTTFCTRI